MQEAFMMTEIKVRKLEKKEHIRSRKLWENIFTEDSPEFLDYYYRVKTSENEIYVIEDAGKIVSMIHLNPFQMRMGDKVYKTHYIVAVATDETYRRQGLMAKLLNHVLQVMTDRGEPFTFLMPAKESIYTPFGFRFVYEQKYGKLTGMPYGCEISFREANSEDCQEIANFVNEHLKAYDITTWRTAEYYQMILEEQKSENGGILLAIEHGCISGVFCYAKEMEYELREPIGNTEKILRNAIYHLTRDEEKEVNCIGHGTQKKPMIMAKVLQPEFAHCFENSKVFINEVV